jgi:hypothetical protein
VRENTSTSRIVPSPRRQAVKRPYSPPIKVALSTSRILSPRPPAVTVSVPRTVLHDMGGPNRGKAFVEIEFSFVYQILIGKYLHTPLRSFPLMLAFSRHSHQLDGDNEHLPWTRRRVVSRLEGDNGRCEGRHVEFFADAWCGNMFPPPSAGCPHPTDAMYTLGVHRR